MLAGAGVRGLEGLGDENAAIIHVLVGQLLGFFRCMQEDCNRIPVRKRRYKPCGSELTLHIADPK